MQRNPEDVKKLTEITHTITDMLNAQLIEMGTKTTNKEILVNAVNILGIRRVLLEMITMIEHHPQVKIIIKEFGEAEEGVAANTFKNKILKYSYEEAQ